MDMPLYFWFIAVHIISLVVGMGAVIVVDTFGLLWLLKKVSLSEVVRVATVTQRLIWIGWVGLVLSGTGLLVEKGFVDNLTLLKLFFVALVGANGVFLRVIKKSLQSVQGGDLPMNLQFRIALASTISQIGWWSAILIGLLHNEWRSRIDWPQSPEIFMGAIVGGILLVSWIGERTFTKK